MARSNALRGSKRSSRTSSKRRTMRSTKIKYQAPSARNQKSQIMANSRAIAKLSQKVRIHRVFTDWQFTFPAAHGINTWVATPITDFSNWANVMRRDTTVNESSHTFIKRCQMNWRMGLNDASYCCFNLFIVTLRRDASNWDPVTTPFVVDEQYVESGPAFAGCNVRLNSNMFKVHFAAYRTLSANTYATTAIPADTAGNPATTFKKGQVNIPLNMSVTLPHFSTATPTNTSWLDKPFAQLPYYHKYYVLMYLGANAAETGRPTCNVDCLFTCINTD